MGHVAPLGLWGVGPGAAHLGVAVTLGHHRRRGGPLHADRRGGLEPGIRGLGWGRLLLHRPGGLLHHGGPDRGLGLLSVLRHGRPHGRRGRGHGRRSGWHGARLGAHGHRWLAHGGGWRAEAPAHASVHARRGRRSAHASHGRRPHLGRLLPRGRRSSHVRPRSAELPRLHRRARHSRARHRLRPLRRSEVAGRTSRLRPGLHPVPHRRSRWPGLHARNRGARFCSNKERREEKKRGQRLCSIARRPKPRVRARVGGPRLLWVGRVGARKRARPRTRPPLSTGARARNALPRGPRPPRASPVGSVRRLTSRRPLLLVLRWTSLHGSARSALRLRPSSAGGD